MDDKNKFGGLTEDANLVSTDFIGKTSDPFTAPLNEGGVLKDFTDSFWRAGGLETERGIYTRVTSPKPVEGFNVYRSPQLKGISDQFLLDHTGEFEGIRSEEELTLKLDSLKKEQQFNKEYSDRDLWNIPATVGYVAGLLLDSTNLIPATAIPKLGKVMGTAYTAAAFAGSTAIRDHLSDSTLSDDQKMYNVAFAGAVGLAFSGAVLGKKWAETAASKNIAETAVSDELARQKKIDNELASVKVEDDGSVKVHETIDEYIDGGRQDISIAPAAGGLTGKLFDFRLKYIEGKLTPKFRLLTSPFKSIRWAAHTLTGTSLKTNREAGSGIEGLVHVQTDNLSIPIFQKSEQLYKKFIDENPNIKMSLDEFESQFHVNKEHASWSTLPQAKYYDELLKEDTRSFGTLWNQAKNAGLVEKDAVASRNFAHFTPDYRAIEKNPTLFKSQLYKAMESGTRKEIEFLKGRISELDKSSDKYLILTTKLDKLNRIMSSKKWQTNRVNYYYDHHIIGSPLKITTLGKSNTDAKSLRFREFYIDHSLLKDFTDKDFRRSTVRSIKEQTVNIAAAKHYGDSDFRKLIKEVKKDLKELVKEHPEKEAEYTKLVEDNLTDFFGGINRLKGYAPDGTIKNDLGHQIVAWLTTGSTLGLMGTSAVNNIPEAFTVAKSMVNLQKETVQAFKDIMGSSVTKLNKSERQRLGFAIQNALQETRLNSLDTVGGSLSHLEELPNKIKSAAYMSYGQTPVTNIMESLKAQSVADIISKVAVAGDKAAQKDIDMVLSLGFTKSELPKIANQFKKYAVKGTDGTISNSLSNWEGNIGIKVRTIIHDEVRKNVISKDVLNSPLWFDNSALGKAFGQFKGFMFAAMEKYALTDLQQGGRRFAEMLVVRTVGGIFAYLAKSSILRNWEDIDTDPKTLLHEGLMRGGGIIGFDTLSDFADQFGLGIGRMLGTNRAMRRKSSYGNDPMFRTIAGAPSVVLSDITKTAMNIGQGNFDPEAYKYLLKYPFGHFATQAIINRVFD